MWYTYTTEYCSAIKKNEIVLFAGKWTELENITFSEVSMGRRRMIVLVGLSEKTGS
jgi:hypothetical protein